MSGRKRRRIDSEGELQGTEDVTAAAAGDADDDDDNEGENDIASYVAILRDQIRRLARLATQRLDEQITLQRVRLTSLVDEARTTSLGPNPDARNVLVAVERAQRQQNIVKRLTRLERVIMQDLSQCERYLEQCVQLANSVGWNMELTTAVQHIRALRGITGLQRKLASFRKKIERVDAYVTALDDLSTSLLQGRTIRYKRPASKTATVIAVESNQTSSSNAGGDASDALRDIVSTINPQDLLKQTNVGSNANATNAAAYSDIYESARRTIRKLIAEPLSDSRLNPR